MTETRPMASHGVPTEGSWGYAQAIVADGLAHVAGQVPRDAQGVPITGSFEVTLGVVVDLVEAALSQVGATLDDLVYTQVHLYASDLDEGVEEYRRRLGATGSAMTMVITEGLNHPDYALEVSAVAVAPAEDGGSMEKQCVTTGNPVDERLGRSAAVRAGNTIFVSGQASVDVDGTPIEDPSFVAHYERAFANFRTALEAAGGTANDVVAVHTWVTEAVPAEDADEVARLHRAAVGEGPNRPASTLVRVSSLSVPGAKVEIHGIAVVGD